MNREKLRKYADFFNKQNNYYKEQLYADILFDCHTNQLSALFKQLLSRNNVKKKLNHILFPKNIKKFCDYSFVLNDNIDISHILNWCNLVIGGYTNEINSYLEIKQEFEKNLFAEEYENAFQYLDIIEKRFGISLWLIGKKMMLYEKISGLEKHIEYFTEIINDADEQYNRRHEEIIGEYEFNRFMAIFDLESCYSESNTSETTLQRRIETYTKNLKEKDISFQKYFRFRYGVDRGDNIEEITYAMMIDAQLSLIDMYETYVIAEQLLLINNDTVHDNEIRDHRLNNLKIIKYNAPINIEEKWFYSILDLYTSGDYELCTQKCETVLKEKPYEFQCIILLVKSCIYLNKRPRIPNKLIQCIYDILTINENDSEAIKYLFSFSRIVRNTSWEYKVIGFLSSKTTMRSNALYKYLSILNDVHISPNAVMSRFFSYDKELYVNIFKEFCPITYGLYLYKIGVGGMPEEINDLNKVKLIMADRLINEKRIKEAIECISLVNRKERYFVERKLRRKIKIFEIINDYYSELIEVTNTVLNNKSIKKRIDMKIILGKIEDHITDIIKYSIYYCVFLYLCDETAVDKIKIAFLNFVDENINDSINELEDLNVDQAILVEFLKNVCSQYNINRCIRLNPDGKKTEEIRIEILRLLIKIDPGNKNVYYEEISLITKKRSLRTRVSQINQSRIFVNTEKIKIENESTLRELFNRYRAVNVVLQQKQSINDEIISNNRTEVKEVNVYDDETKTGKKSNPTKDQQQRILHDMISIILEEFLFNHKYGLNTSLSSRIRHGVGKRKLEAAFQECDLLSKKKTDSSKEYLINEFLDSVLDVEKPYSIKIKRCFSDFTFKIETKIEEVIKGWLNIQYKTGVLSNGGNVSPLNYSHVVDKTRKAIEYNNITDFDFFYSLVISHLWDYTREFLGNIRERVRGELYNYFCLELSILERNINNIVNDYPESKDKVSLLIRRINKCRATITNYINQFAQYLDKYEITYNDFSISDLLETCLQILSSLNADISKASIEQCVHNTEIVINGNYFPYFVDIITILLNNAIDHSEIKRLEELKIKIDVNVIYHYNRDKAARFFRAYLLTNNGENDLNKDFLIISVSNNIGDNLDIKVLDGILQKKLREAREIECVRKHSQREGGAGIYKLVNILTNNINSQYYICASASADIGVKMVICIETSMLTRRGEIYEYPFY